MADFDPNNPGRSATRRGKNWTFDWATYVPSRRPQFKVHATKGHATSACKGKAYYVHEKGGYLLPDEVRLYKKENELWCEVAIHRFLPRGECISVIKGE